MKTFALQKRLAASVLNVGINKVWLDPERLNEIREAITKADIEALIKEKAIKKKPIKGIKRRAGRTKQFRRRKGLGRGHGKKRKIVNVKKKEHMIRIRNLRNYINTLKQEKAINEEQSIKLRRLAKAGIFKNKKDINERIKP